MTDSESQPCQICVDIGSGYHYGVWSCEGCKAFFKRSMQGSHDYVCPATDNCTIDRNRRKSCQACRFRKCVTLGMADHYTKKERRRRRKKRKPNGENSNENSSNNAKNNQGENENCRNDTNHTIDNNNIPTKKIKTKEEPVSPLNYNSVLAKDEEAAKFLDTLISIEPPPRMTEHDYSQPTTDTSLIASMVKLADKQLMDTIQWAKRIPGYKELHLNDQIKLLDSAWMDTLLCGVAYKSMGVEKNILIMADDFHWSRPQADISGAGIAHEHMTRLATRFVDVAVTKEEMVLLRAMLLFNADSEGFECAEQIEKMRDLIIEALKVATRRSQRNRTMDKDKWQFYSENRASHILLLLPHIKHCANNCMAHLFDAKYEGKMPTCDLIEDVLQIRLRPPNSSEHSELAGIAGSQGFVGRGYPGLPLLSSVSNVIQNSNVSLDFFNATQLANLGQSLSAGDIMNANISAVISQQMTPCGENIWNSATTN